MSWRPDGWNNLRLNLAVEKSHEGNDGVDFLIGMEAGADAMHEADIEWIKQHILITEGVFTKDDWLAFTEGRT